MNPEKDIPKPVSGVVDGNLPYITIHVLEIEFPCGYKIKIHTWIAEFEGNVFGTCPIHGKECKKG